MIKAKWDEDKQGYISPLFLEPPPKDYSEIEMILFLATLRSDKLYLENGHKKNV